HHFIGKDITYFHTLFWPGMLKVAGFQLPTKVHIHGFLTVAGEKMSKSKGTFVMAETYLKHLDPSYLRYYYASKLGPRLDDIDLSLDEFAQKVNSDIVGKVVNLASRTAKLAESTGLAEKYPDDGGLFSQGAQAGGEIAQAYEACDYARATRLIMELADRANGYFDAHAPWKLKNQTDQQERLQDICTVSLNLFRQIVIYLAPVLPRLATQTGELLGDPISGWDQAQNPLLGTPVATFQHMLKRVETKDIEAMIEDSKVEETGVTSEGAKSTHDDTDAALQAEPLADEITIDEFAKVDFRVARVLNAEDVPEAKKLLKITLGLGGEHQRTVFAGIKEAYKPEQLVGRLVIVVANLAPRKMKFGTSEGMIVASGSGGKEVFLLGVDEGAVPGQRVH
ncbi:MAG: methionine--tRNA ligase subunit beta, partial [Planctomycetales bacterium]|nr:methionine--tRNA ligase subunit beta [Planctomycetales bacterium]